MFAEFVRKGQVKRISRDQELAKSLVKIAKLRLRNTSKMEISEETSFSVVENAYEAVKELIDALLAFEGYKSYSHEAGIAFLKEFHMADMGEFMISRIDTYRKIRHDIKYRGILTTPEEGRIALKELSKAFEKVLGLVQGRLYG